MKQHEIFKPGTKVRFTDDCTYYFDVETMKGHGLEDIYGVVQKDGHYHLFSKKTGEQLSLADNRDGTPDLIHTWCFHLGVELYDNEEEDAQ